MLYLAANNSRVWKLRQGGLPLGWIMSPDGWRSPVRGQQSMPFALDNGLYHPPDAPAKGMKALPPFYRMLSRPMANQALFVVVPDQPYDAERTRKLYRKHQRHVRTSIPGVPVAMAVQDGMVPDDLDMIEPPGAVFIAGSTEWKWRTAEDWVIKSAQFIASTKIGFLHVEGRRIRNHRRPRGRLLPG
jgi:hypothetical protein